MKKAHKIGLTGSIGMGKSTVSSFFADEGVAVWDADGAVHRLYHKGGAAVDPVSALVPEALSSTGIDRSVLSAKLKERPALLKDLEGIVHPLVAQDRERFASGATAEFLLFDIPLLFEGRLEDQFDTLVVVSAPLDVQRARVLDRPSMTSEKFDFILSKQMPDAEKRKRADFIIETNHSFDDTRKRVKEIMRELRR